MTNTIKKFPTFAYERFAAKSRLAVKKQAKKINMLITNEDIDLINKASLELFTELLEESIESKGFFILDDFALTDAINGVWYVWQINKRSSV